MMDVGKVRVMNAEAASFICCGRQYKRWDGAAEGVGATFIVLLWDLCGEPAKMTKKFFQDYLILLHDSCGK